MPVLDQDAEGLDLRWIFGDPINLQFMVQSVDWSGSYTAQVRRGRTRADLLMITLTVVATLVGADTTFALTATSGNSLLVPAGGEYYWDLQQTGFRTRLKGRVYVEPDISI